MLSRTSALFGLAVVANAHFFIQDPPYLGFDDTKMTQAPCGGFSPTIRDGASDFSVGGSAIAVLTTHGTVSWEYHAALVSDPTNWVTIYGSLNQKGVGDFCLPTVTAPKEWAGKHGVIQVIQHAHDGDLHQATGGPESVPGSCKNGTGVSAEFQKPPTQPATTLPGTVAPPPASTSAKPTSKHDHGDHSHHHESGHEATEPVPSSGGHAHPTTALSQVSSVPISKPSATATGVISGTGITTKLPSGTSRRNSTTSTGTPPAQFTGAAAGMNAGSNMVFALGGVLAIFGWAF
ncbi:hypothetical protein B0J11DRAFT_585008 [Dendryphion nanum]|uniref:Copper acquisition factor BIM1-like domain-containing protein n=1 Tax=Dendryphion nanum TaxID=256645 RepID=A0A9P9D7J3_9PLEO|nr:hypothetical protein B0J11DRAFT_585008 [Dendryphion nanum]